MRVLWRVMLPLCFVTALIYVWQGVPQTLTGQVEVATLEGGVSADHSWTGGEFRDHQAYWH